VRPKMMTVAAAFMGLMPIMWSVGAGADVMKRVAAPMVGGLATSFLMELLVYPAIYLLWKWKTEVKDGALEVPAALEPAAIEPTEDREPVPELR
jgi:Cu(I)/Ag(I) efflux system membrane protein CusA/SilA